MFAIANDLKGFQISSLRIKLLKENSDGTVAVITADAMDSGTYLILNKTQLSDFHLVVGTSIIDVNN